MLCKTHSSLGEKSHCLQGFKKLLFSGIALQTHVFLLLCMILALLECKILVSLDKPALYDAENGTYYYYDADKKQYVDTFSRH